MKWTEEKPTVEGFYWISNRDNAGGDVDIVRVVKTENGVLSVWNILDGADWPLKNYPPHTLWMGPIAVPEKPKQ